MLQETRKDQAAFRCRWASRRACSRSSEGRNWFPARVVSCDRRAQAARKRRSVGEVEAAPEGGQRRVTGEEDASTARGVLEMGIADLGDAGLAMRPGWFEAPRVSFICDLLRGRR